ncbi:hypothetical protein B0H13DRAFT_2667132 [Mycena leptocephala]|nr:hypothetical protein B0H13DRAFT_2667132 [Mycena leptocephala]
MSPALALYLPVLCLPSPSPMACTPPVSVLSRSLLLLHPTFLINLPPPFPSPLPLPPPSHLPIAFSVPSPSLPSDLNLALLIPFIFSFSLFWPIKVLLPAKRRLTPLSCSRRPRLLHIRLEWHGRGSASAGAGAGKEGGDAGVGVRKDGVPKGRRMRTACARLRCRHGRRREERSPHPPRERSMSTHKPTKTTATHPSAAALAEIELLDADSSDSVSSDFSLPLEADTSPSYSIANELDKEAEPRSRAYGVRMEGRRIYRVAEACRTRKWHIGRS